MNLYAVKEDAIYNTLYADSMLAEVSDEQIEKRDFVLVESDIISSVCKIHIMEKNSQKTMFNKIDNMQYLV